MTPIRSEKPTDAAWLLVGMLIVAFVPASTTFARGSALPPGTVAELGAAVILAETRGLPPQLWEEVRKRTASDAASLDSFGYSVSINGDTIVVGATFDDDAGSASGSAYVFERNKSVVNNWGEVKKLTASDAAPSDKFGFSVAISTDTIVVGAPLDNDACMDVAECDSGSVYVFERHHGGADTWAEVAKLTGSDATTGDEFGRSVAISGDTIVVGAPFRTETGNVSGVAYVFQRDQGGANNWGEAAKLIPLGNGAGDNFGISAAISGDTVVVGAWGDGASGSANIFKRDQGGVNHWGELKKLTASDATTGASFGASVSINAETIVVGAPLDDDGCPAPNCNSGSAYVFERDQGGTDNWGEVIKLTASDAAALDQFSGSVAISGDTIVIGTERDSDAGSQSGSAYIFGRNQDGTGNWGEVAKLTASDAAAEDHFAWSVAISGDTTVVGAWGNDDAGDSSGSAYVFERVPVATDLSITKTDSVDPVTAGSQLTYTITVRNFGPGDARDVVVTDTLPPEVTLLSTNGCAEDPSGVPTCTLGTVTDGGFDAYTVLVTVDPATTGTMTNQADVSSGTPEALPGDESVSETTMVTTSANLSVTETDSVDPVIAGTQLSYSITVTNFGPGDARNVVVTDTLPPGVTLVLTNGCAEDPLAVPTCTLGTIMAGTQTTYVITVMVDADTLGIITNQVTVSSSTPEANPGDESASASTNSILSAQIFDDGFESGETSAWSSVGEL